MQIKLDNYPAIFISRLVYLIIRIYYSFIMYLVEFLTVGYVRGRYSGMCNFLDKIR